MAVKVHDRDEYLANKKAEAKAQYDESRRQAEQSQRKFKQELRKGGVRDFFRMLWASIWHMGMYSEDPYISRIAMVHTAQEQIGVQRQISAQQRVEDRMGEEERMRMMARIMIEEVDRSRREHA